MVHRDADGLDVGFVCWASMSPPLSVPVFPSVRLPRSRSRMTLQKQLAKYKQLWLRERVRGFDQFTASATCVVPASTGYTGTLRKVCTDFQTRQIPKAFLLFIV